MHCLAAITVTMRLVHNNTQTSTRMHRLTAIIVIMRLVHKNTQTSTLIHGLERMAVSIGLNLPRKKNTTYTFLSIPAHSLVFV
jgi:hypothetical protein